MNRQTTTFELAAAACVARAYAEPECQNTLVDADLCYAAARVLIREGWVPPDSALQEALDAKRGPSGTVGP